MYGVKDNGIAVRFVGLRTYVHSPLVFYRLPFWNAPLSRPLSTSPGALSRRNSVTSQTAGVFTS